MAIQMSSELLRGRAIDAFETANDDSVFNVPLERVSTREPLLVIEAENQYLQQALAAVLTIDPHAGYPQ